MGAGRPAGGPDVPDDGTLGDPDTAPDPLPDIPEMAVVGGESFRVPDDDEIAVCAFVPGELDDSISYNFV